MRFRCLLLFSLKDSWSGQSNPLFRNESTISVSFVLFSNHWSIDHISRLVADSGGLSAVFCVAFSLLSDPLVAISDAAIAVIFGVGLAGMTTSGSLPLLGLTLPLSATLSLLCRSKQLPLLMARMPRGNERYSWHRC